jgi:hypothetical protein
MSEPYGSFPQYPVQDRVQSGYCCDRDESQDLVNINPYAGTIIAKSIRTDELVLGKIKQSPETLTVSVPSTDFPTIQSAIDFAANRHAGDLTIKVAKGQYFEDLRISRMAASIPEPAYSATPVLPTGGFTLLGDARSCVGRSFHHQTSVWNPSNDTGLGVTQLDAYTPVNRYIITGGVNTITVQTVDGDQINFTTAGVVVGDLIKIRSNITGAPPATTASYNLRTVTAVGTNTLTYSGASVTVGGFLSGLTICPNVELLPLTGGRMGSVMLQNSALNAVGIWFNLDVTRGAAGGLLSNMYASYSQLNTNWCLFDDSDARSLFSNVLLDNNSHWTNRIDNYNGLFGPCTILRSGSFFFGASSSLLVGLTYLTTGMSAQENSSIGCFDTGLIACAISVATDTGGGGLEFRGEAIGTGRGLSAFGATGEVNGFSVDCSYNGTTPIPLSTGIRMGNSYLFCGGTIKNAAIGALVRGASNLVFASDEATDPIFINCGVNVIREAQNIVVDRTLNPENIHRYLAAGPTALDNNALFQTLVGAPGPVALTLNPAAVSGRGFPDNAHYYVGKRYTLSAKTAAAHTLTLTPPPGVPYVVAPITGSPYGALSSTGASVGPGYVTYTTSTPHAFSVGEPVVVAGIVPAGFNFAGNVVESFSTTSFVLANPFVGPGSVTANGGVTNYAITGAIGSTPAVGQIRYTTSIPHKYAVGNVVTITGLLQAGFNLVGTVVAVAATDPLNLTNTQFVIANTFVGLGSATVNGVAFYSITGVTASNPAVGQARYQTSINHGFTVGAVVTVAGLTPGGYNIVGTVLSIPRGDRFVLANATVGALVPAPLIPAITTPGTANFNSGPLSFTGSGAVAGNNTATFAGAVEGEFIEFMPVSTSKVMVLGGNGVTLSTV